VNTVSDKTFRCLHGLGKQLIRLLPSSRRSRYFESYQLVSNMKLTVRCSHQSILHEPQLHFCKIFHDWIRFRIRLVRLENTLRTGDRSANIAETRLKARYFPPTISIHYMNNIRSNVGNRAPDDSKKQGKHPSQTRVNRIVPTLTSLIQIPSFRSNFHDSSRVPY
jgi:hypothetical protein